jgi:glycosyltransferase involved in cell wall biosynthesis
MSGSGQGARRSTLDPAVLVIPMFNEGFVIAEVVATARTRFSRIVCVDDGSSDGCHEMARTAGAEVVRHPVNLGQGAAIETGIAHALRDPAVRYIVTFDADGQHSVDDAAAMVLRAERDDLQVVLGSRFLGSTENMSGGRRALLRGAVRFTRMTTGLRLTDAHNGLRVLRRDAAQDVKLRLPGMSHASEILTLIARNRWTYAEHPVRIAYTDYSRAKGQRGYNALNIVFELAVNRLRAAA